MFAASAKTHFLLVLKLNVALLTAFTECVSLSSQLLDSFYKHSQDTLPPLFFLRVTCPANIPYVSVYRICMSLVLIEWGLWEGAAQTAQHESLNGSTLRLHGGGSPSGQQPPI